MMRVIIVGRGAGWRRAPRVGETWGVYHLVRKRPFKRIIEMHYYDNVSNRVKQARRYAADRGITYLTAENYPLKEVIGFFKTDFFANSICYAIALAIYEEATIIDLYGVNTSNPTEFANENPCVNYWCGQAMGRGIEVNVHEGGRVRIMRTTNGLLYGYKTPQKGV